MSEYSYHRQGFNARRQTMGATAEAAFLQLHPTAHRLGIDRPDFAVAKMPVMFRHAPDFLMADGAYEVMGVSSRSKDASLKMKIEKLESLQTWNVYGPVYLWVWDSAKKVYWCAPLNEWRDRFHYLAEIDRFPDNNKPYWKLQLDDFPVEPCNELRTSA